MNIIKAFNQTIDYIESVLTDDIDEKKIQQLSGYSYALFSRIFSIFTQTTLQEYIRLRKLTKAAFEIRKKNDTIIDIAIKYGYNSADSFSKAFKKFHNCTPIDVRYGKNFIVFSKIQLSVTIEGGTEMNVRVQKKESFIVGGIRRENIQSTECPKIWKKLLSDFKQEKLMALGNGECFGMCYNVENPNFLNYMACYDIKDEKQAQKLGLDIMHVPAAEYIVVSLKGAVPDCIHTGWDYVMRKIFPEEGYTHAGSPDFEMYKAGNMYDSNYEMELWIPIIRNE